MTFYDDDEAVPVTRITAGAIGELGRRAFILQAQIAQQSISWVLDKAHAVALCRTIPRLLAEVQASYPELEHPLVAAKPSQELHQPLQPEFRVGGLGISYDRIHDLVVLTLVDAASTDSDNGELLEDSEPPAEVHVFTTRGQALLLGRRTEEVVNAGRPVCPLCAEPIDDFGHFCAPHGARGRRGGDYLQ